MNLPHHDPDAYGDAVADAYDELYAEIPQTAEAVQRLVELAEGGPVCELGIGTGRLALPLRQHGLQVSGIDSSAEMVAQLRAKPLGDEIPVAIGDFADTSAPGGPFSLVALAWNTIFAVADTSAQIACFAKVSEQLRAGGRFVVESFVVDPRTFHHGQAIQVRTMTADHVELQLASYDAPAGRINRVLLNVRNGAIKLHAVNDAYATPRELDLMARMAGMELESRCADWVGAPFTAESTNHVSVYVKSRR